MRFLSDYLAALGFLTRLGPARAVTDLSGCPAWFGAVGVTLGLVLAAPLAAGFLDGHALAGAFFYAVASLAATRGLHLDGFADVADAWGSLAKGERFFAVMKDSRVGAFGALALAVAVVGQVSLGADLLAGGRLGVLAAAPGLGRGFAVLLLHVCRDIPRPGLGALFVAGASRRATGFALATAVGFALLAAGVRATAWACLFGAVIVWGLARLARENGAVNGDFCGAAVVAVELGACLAGLC